ncbi:TIGR04279 domain-containing protein [Methanosarcina sp. 1.H.T.1A.1]|uniref:TIGR04279 domain-containing protein n=1 Tax=Methanosarcina sp. 1.H.T.1A.1 TaxID=1483602 RepID=UPI00064FC6FD|nr:TIGR04279 domain-containing protein [Methanosarcina sp. 1.H.T.1A.1]
MKKRSGILIGMILLMLSVIPSGLSAALSEEEPYIARIEKNNEVVFFADHNESQTEGNWILLSGGKAIRLPEPFTFTYNGTNRLELEGADLELNVENYTDYLITYPYSTHPFYTVDESVEMDFSGSSDFKDQEAGIYLVDMRDTGLSSVYDAFKAIKEENPDSFKGIFNDTFGSYTQVGAVTLDKNGDIPATLNLGTQPAGLYGIFVLLNDSSEEKKILSVTFFEVLEYDFGIEAPESLEEGNNLEISLSLENASEPSALTYGAVLVKESAYCADMRFDSNGTWAGTDVLINGIDIIDEFDIDSSNLESKLGKDELQTEIQTLIGEGNGTITIGEENESTLSLTAFDLPTGDYLLFAGAFEEGNGLVGIAQKEVTITGAGTSMDSSLDSGLDSSSSASSSRFSSESESSASSSIEAAPETEAPEESSVKDLTLTEEAKSASPENGVAAEARKNSIPNGISFLAGFAGVIMLGIVVMNRRRI